MSRKEKGMIAAILILWCGLWSIWAMAAGPIPPSPPQRCTFRATINYHGRKIPITGEFEYEQQ